MDANQEEYILSSGGEPCIWPGIIDLVAFLHSRGYKVRLSTNGTYPDRVKYMVDSGILSFVAMDIKTDLSRQGTNAKPSTNEWDTGNHHVPKLEGGRRP